jgi:cell filamentation protein
VFDPFGDSHQDGYLRNLRGLNSPVQIKKLEAQAFLANLPQALELLVGKDLPSYEDLKEVHRCLFSSVYPWAGLDRMETSPAKSVYTTKIKMQVVVFENYH